MGAYSINLLESLNDYENIEPEDIDELIDNDDVEEIYEESVIATAMRVVYENSTNWNSIMEACAIDELHYLEENGTEMIYEGSRVRSFINASVEFFRNIWNKIQGIFKRFIMAFDATTKTDKDFLNKYKKELNTAEHKLFGDKEVKVYDYIFYANGENGGLHQAIGITDANDIDNILRITGVENKGLDAMSLSDLKDANSAYTEDKAKSVLDKYRAKFLSSVTEVEAGEFNKLLKEKFQGSDSKDDKSLGEFFKTCKTFMARSATVKKDIEKDLNAYKKNIDGIIKALVKLEKSLTKEMENARPDANDAEDPAKKAGAKLSIVSKAIRSTKDMKNIQISATGVQLQCLKSASRQAKSVCVTALAFNPKKSANESGLFIQQESDMSLLDNVNMI